MTANISCPNQSTHHRLIRPFIHPADRCDHRVTRGAGCRCAEGIETMGDAPCARISSDFISSGLDVPELNEFFFRLLSLSPYVPC